MIYFFEDRVRPAARIKIGSSADPIRRRLQVQSLVGRPLWPLGVMPGGEPEEKSLHRRFAAINVRGPEIRGVEWFSASPELVRFIKESAQDWTDMLAEMARAEEASRRLDLQVTQSRSNLLHTHSVGFGDHKPYAVHLDFAEQLSLAALVLSCGQRFRRGMCVGLHPESVDRVGEALRQYVHGQTWLSPAAREEVMNFFRCANYPPETPDAAVLFGRHLSCELVPGGETLVTMITGELLRADASCRTPLGVVGQLYRHDGAWKKSARGWEFVFQHAEMVGSDGEPIQRGRTPEGA